MKKLVMRVELEDDKAKKKAMRTVSTLRGIDSITMDMKEKKMTVIGTVDAVHVVSKLRKYWQVSLITLGPAKEPEKKEEPKPPAAAAPAVEEGKKEEGKKEEGKKEEGKEEGKKEEGKGEEKKEEGKKEEGGGGKKEEGGGGGSKKEDGEAAPKKPPQMMMSQPIPEHLLEMVRARQYNPYMSNYPPYMAMANPYMNHPQMHHQPTYYVQSVEENPNGCTIL